MCLSETFLNFSIESNADRMPPDGYNLISSDHPSDSKKDDSAFVIKGIFLLLKEIIFAL